MLHGQYIEDIAESARAALSTVDPMPFYAQYGDNTWAAVKAYLDTATEYAATPAARKYAGVLGAANVFIAGTTFVILSPCGWKPGSSCRSTREPSNVPSGRGRHRAASALGWRRHRSGTT